MKDNLSNAQQLLTEYIVFYHNYVVAGTDKEMVDRARLELLSEISAGEEAIRELAECKAEFKMIMEEKCPYDEKHCTCVPLLRKKVAELEKEVERLKGEK